MKKKIQKQKTKNKTKARNMQKGSTKVIPKTQWKSINVQLDTSKSLTLPMPCLVSYPFRVPKLGKVWGRMTTDLQLLSRS